LKAAVQDARCRGLAPSLPPESSMLGLYTTISNMLKHIAWKDVELEQLNPLLDRQMISGDKIMLARVLLKKGSVVPEHSHENEQVTYILDGALKFWIDGKEIVVRTGEVLCIPAHMPHKAEAVEDTVDLDVFYPPRQDWLNKTDGYLRGASTTHK
jgi:quercetin dioxygenase-like cupin family protein